MFIPMKITLRSYVIMDHYYNFHGYYSIIVFRGAQRCLYRRRLRRDHMC